MFEKDAEEYAEKHAFRIPYDGSDKFYDDKDYECSKEGFQKGAEFGYNKANEQLTKAKEIIKKLLEHLSRYVWIGDNKTKPAMEKDITEAEQFLNEVEK